MVEVLYGGSLCPPTREGGSLWTPVMGKGGSTGNDRGSRDGRSMSKGVFSKGRGPLCPEMGVLKDEGALYPEMGSPTIRALSFHRLWSPMIRGPFLQRWGVSKDEGSLCPEMGFPMMGGLQ